MGMPSQTLGERNADWRRSEVRFALKAIARARPAPGLVPTAREAARRAGAGVYAAAPKVHGVAMPLRGCRGGVPMLSFGLEPSLLRNVGP